VIDIPKLKGKGLPPMANNWNPNIKAPVDRIYEHLPELQVQHGRGLPNPAVNNWTPAKIREPKVYEYSPSLQYVPKIKEPALFTPNIGGKQQGHLSYDDGKPLRQTAKYYNSFIHVSKNPLIIK
jgi:hypothetical protein